jgi:hypothetical protein
LLCCCSPLLRLRIVARFAACSFLGVRKNSHSLSQVVTSKLTALLCTLLSRSLSLSVSLNSLIARVLVEIKARARSLFFIYKSELCAANRTTRGEAAGVGEIFY